MVVTVVPVDLQAMFRSPLAAVVRFQSILLQEVALFLEFKLLQLQELVEMVLAVRSLQAEMVGLGEIRVARAPTSQFKVVEKFP
ncbi:hypothetical protein [Synechococcus sp. MIT S9503]|uniref:hypothetical protein n=1 Tax=Synechococcus sp. MIT S9503 TaxID=3082547 RepID=UPI0039A7858F